MGAARKSITTASDVAVVARSKATRPINLAHLARQTMGDRALEQEVLKLFVKQALGFRDDLARASAGERKVMVHTLKGSARSVGALALADCLAAIEAEPASRREIRRIPGLIQDVCDFVAAISR